jgi:hypothetical protein
MSDVVEGMIFISSRDLDTGNPWVRIELNKKALDYIREGIAIKADALEREMVVEGESVRPNFEFATNLKDGINVLRESLEE